MRAEQVVGPPVHAAVDLSRRRVSIWRQTSWPQRRDADHTLGRRRSPRRKAATSSSGRRAEFQPTPTQVAHVWISRSRLRQSPLECIIPRCFPRGCPASSRSPSSRASPRRDRGLRRHKDDRPAKWSFISATIIEPSCATANCHSAITQPRGRRSVERATIGYYSAGRQRGPLRHPERPAHSDVIDADERGGIAADAARLSAARRPTSSSSRAGSPPARDDN